MIVVVVVLIVVEVHVTTFSINRVRFDLIKIWRFHTIVLHIVLADYRTLLKTSLNSIGQ